jgi:glycosyltransferase involved in cell wall biosynthesis
MNDKIEISVVIPAYNEEKYIARAVRSILSQQFKDLEVIVVDDGSKDRTIKAVRSIPDPRVRVISNDANWGVVHCLNRGIEYSRGKYIARMDADDMSLPERLGKQYNVMENDQDCVVVGTGIYFLNYRDLDFRRIIPVCDDEPIRKEMMTHNPINTGSAMYRKAALEKVNGFNISDNIGKIIEGFSLLIKLAKIGKLSNIADAEYVYFHRKGQGNRSAHHGFKTRNTSMSEMIERAGKLSEKHYKSFIASKTWKVYHFIPRPLQVLIRSLVSGRKHIKLTKSEIKNLETMYESLAPLR